MMASYCYQELLKWSLAMIPPGIDGWTADQQYHHQHAVHALLHGLNFEPVPAAGARTQKVQVARVPSIPLSFSLYGISLSTLRLLDTFSHGNIFWNCHAMNQCRGG